MNSKQLKLLHTIPVLSEFVGVTFFCFCFVIVCFGGLFGFLCFLGLFFFSMAWCLFVAGEDGSNLDELYKNYS